jgi:hypothetical protein
MSKNRAKKKPRSRHITFDFGKPTTINAVSYDPKTGLTQMFHDGVPVSPERAVVEQAYERNKGPKVLVWTSVPFDKAFANPNRALEHYSEIYAVDTNTKMISGELVSVSGVVGGVNIPVPGHTAIRYRPIHCVEFRGIEGNPEKVGWVEAIEGISRSPMFSPQKKYALIVDAYLDKLVSFNERSEPMIDGFYLPPEFTLVYASTDTANETLANQMLALADKISTVILSGIEREPPEFPLSEVSGKRYRRLRLWTLRA